MCRITCGPCAGKEEGESSSFKVGKVEICGSLKKKKRKGGGEGGERGRACRIDCWLSAFWLLQEKGEKRKKRRKEGKGGKNLGSAGPGPAE